MKYAINGNMSRELLCHIISKILMNNWEYLNLSKARGRKCLYRKGGAIRPNKVYLYFVDSIHIDMITCPLSSRLQ